MDAATTPNAIKIMPLMKRVIAWKALLDLATSPSFPPRQPNSEFVKNPSTTKAIPNVGICALVEPALGSTNCGRKARKNGPAFGFGAGIPGGINDPSVGGRAGRFPSMGLADAPPSPKPASPPGPKGQAAP